MIISLIQYIYEYLDNNFFEMILININLQYFIEFLNNFFNLKYQMKNDFFQQFDYDSIESSRGYVDYVYDEILMDLNSKSSNLEIFLEKERISLKLKEYKIYLRLTEEHYSCNFLTDKYLNDFHKDYPYIFEYYFYMHKNIFIWKHTGIFIFENDHDLLKFRTIGFIFLIALCIWFKVYGFFG